MTRYEATVELAHVRTMLEELVADRLSSPWTDVQEREYSRLTRYEVRLLACTRRGYLQLVPSGEGA